MIPGGLLHPDHEMLRKPLPKTEFTQEQRTKLAEDLVQYSLAMRGLGISANQVGIEKRAFCVTAGDYKEVFFNPEIIKYSENTNMLDEGCLTYPGVFVSLKRPMNITIRYETVDGETKEQDFGGLTARIIQHEYDHIEGILFTDHLSMLKKKLIGKKLQNIMEGKARPDYKMKYVNKKGR
jgi:peptide deformylase